MTKLQRINYLWSQDVLSFDTINALNAIRYLEAEDRELNEILTHLIEVGLNLRSIEGDAQ